MPKPIKLKNGEVIEERREGERRKDSETNNKNNSKTFYIVSWGAIILLATVVGWLITAKGQTEERMYKIESTHTEITAQLREIRKDIDWIKDYLQEMRRR